MLCQSIQHSTVLRRWQGRYFKIQLDLVDWIHLWNYRASQKYIEPVGKMLQPSKTGYRFLNSGLHHSLSVYVKLHYDATLSILSHWQGVRRRLPD